ncbi:hypothetical protein Ndes2526A_g05720 [Nannochloris sp. 'desiccata']
MADAGKRKQGGGGGGEARKKRFFSDNAKVHGLPGGGARGVLISTYIGKESQGAREGINILSEAYEALCPEVADAKNQAVGDDKGGDISALLASEVADLKDHSKQDFGFQLLGINGLVFVQVKYEGGPSPAELVQHVCREVKASKQNKTRLCQRFYPVEHQCTADLDAMQEMAKEVLAKHFPADSTEGITFAVEFEKRANNIDRMKSINAFAEVVPAPHKVNLNNPSKTILVNVLKNTCGLAVVDNYKELSKFNIRALAGEGEPTALRTSKKNGEPAEAKSEEVGA